MLRLSVIFYYLILTCVFLTLSQQNQTERPQLKIHQGILQGAIRKSLNGRDFSAFTGIPYAEPPVGPLRFEAAVPARPWSGILDATKNHAACPQMDIFMGNHKIRGDEDCLYLNVYTPQQQQLNHQLLPVMFYIHGGGWLSGEANMFNPDVLLNHDVVLVTINYRLGLLGFLSTGNNVVPGNNGLKDQNLALKWVKKSINYFGGDPNRITVFGQSAGGASAHFHMLSPLSKDLINGVIIQSGTALSPWALGTKETTLKNTQKLAKLLDCPYAPSQAFINCLRKLPAYEFIEQEHKFREWSYFPAVPFPAVIEEESDEAFLSEEPSEIIKLNKVPKIPVMVGFTTEDGAVVTSSILHKKQLTDDLNTDFNRIAPFIFMYDENIHTTNKLAEKIWKLYFENEQLNNNTKDKFSDMITDSYFHTSTYNLVRLHRQYTNQNVYYYKFGYRGSESFTQAYSAVNDQSDYGTCHCDELLYLFNIRIDSERKSTPNDLRMYDVLSSLWTNFAKTGNPTPNTNDIITAIWNPVRTNNFEFYSIKTALEMQNSKFTEKLQFWNNLYLNPPKLKDEL